MTGGPTVTQVAAPSPPITGGLYRGPIGTALPVDTSTALNAAFISLGYLDQDGITYTIDRPNNKQYAWGGALVATLQQHWAFTFKFKLYQILDPDVLMSVHSDTNVTVTAATSTVGTLTTTLMNPKLNVNSAWVVTGNYQLAGFRIAAPNARITMTGDLKLTHQALAVYDCTLETFPDTAGNFAYQYWNDGLHI